MPVSLRITRITLTVIALLIAASATPASSIGSTEVSVTLHFNASVTFPFDEPAFVASCVVQVEAGQSGENVLDQAVSDECIDGWDHQDFACCGRFVTSITGRDAPESTDGRNTHDVEFLCGAFSGTVSGPKMFSFWSFYVNGADPGDGIDGYAAASGDELEFAYVVDTCTFANSLAFFMFGPPPVAPVNLEGDDMTDPGST